MVKINLPDNVTEYIDEQIARRGYRNASEFVRSLIDADKRRRLMEEFESTLKETIAGPFVEFTDDDFNDIRRQGRQIIAKRRNN